MGARHSHSKHHTPLRVHSLLPDQRWPPTPAEDEELLFRVFVTDLSPQWGGAAKVVKDRKPPVSVLWLRRKGQRS